MADTLPDVLRFAFILLVPLALVAGGALSLFGLGALIYIFEHPKELRSMVQGAFRRPEKPARKLSPSHYYQPYWTRDASSRRVDGP